VRPNPIAAAVVEILAIRDGELDVVGLDCLDGTPLLDIKRARFYEGSETASGLS
jgi:tRNA (Thr-GGU) A37 N-methylase